MRSFAAYTFATLLCGISLLQAQETFDTAPTSGHIGLSYGSLPPRHPDDLPGTYRSKWGGISAVVPVSRSLTLDDEGASLTHYSLSASLRRNATELPSIATERTVTKAFVGASWMHLNSSKHAYMLSLGAGIAEDHLSGGTPDLQLRLTALGSFRLTDPLRLVYGANYSSLFGRDLLLPILGAHWKIAPDWAGSLLLPFSASVRYAASAKIMLKAAVSVTGERVRIANAGDFAGEPSVLEARTSGAKASLMFAGKISSDFRMTIETGAMTRTQFKITADDRTLVSSRIGSAGYLAVGFQFYFSAADDEESVF